MHFHAEFSHLIRTEQSYIGLASVSHLLADVTITLVRREKFPYFWCV